MTGCHGDGRWRSRRWVLRLFFESAEVEDILGDLDELSTAARRRGRLRGALYYWTQFARYPAHAALDTIRRHLYDSRTGERTMRGLGKDMGYAFRSLWRSLGFTALTVTILATALGANIAAFTVVKGVLLDPLPIEEPERLFSVWTMDTQTGRHGRVSPGNVTDLKGLDEVFSHVAAFRGNSATLTGEGPPQYLRGGSVSASYFEALGIRPLHGRAFRPQEEDPGAAPVVILGHALWQQRFGADPGVVGRSIELDGNTLEVVGVTRPGPYPRSADDDGTMHLPAGGPDYLVPLRFSSALWLNRRPQILGVLGRLAPGVEPASARSALATLSARLSSTDPVNENEAFHLTRFRDDVVGAVSFALVTLFGAVALVLLIATVNVAALFVLRTDDRASEMAIRTAMGASRSRLARQLVVEGLTVIGIATVGALLIARWGLGLTRQAAAYEIPRLASIDIGGGVVAVSLVLAVALGTAFGLAPALRLRRAGRLATAGQRRLGQRPGQRRLQESVVAIQAGLAIVVLVGAALLTRSFSALSAVDPGVRALDTWVIPLNAGASDMDRIVERVRELPGIAAAAVAYDHPLQRSWGDSFLIDGEAPSPTGDSPSASLRPFGEGYFRTVGIDVIAGRVPDALDLSGEVGYAVINETLADRYFPGEDPIGRTVQIPSATRIFGESATAAYEIVGVVRDVRFRGPANSPEPGLYVPLSHFPARGSTLLVRPETTEGEVLPNVRRTITSVNPGLAPQSARRLRDLLDDLLARPRFNMTLLVSFAAMGLLLCGLGVYGLVARTVKMRFREIGVRVALGAGPGKLARAVIASALRPVAIGAVLGLMAAAAAVRLIQVLLYGVSSTDPAAFGVALGFVLLMGVVAAVVPTRRALSVDPVSTLKAE